MKVGDLVRITGKTPRRWSNWRQVGSIGLVIDTTSPDIRGYVIAEFPSGAHFVHDDEVEVISEGR